VFNPDNPVQAEGAARGREDTLPHRNTEGVQPLYLRQMTSKKEKKVFFEILIK
jgi:hypothetical protein